MNILSPYALWFGLTIPVVVVFYLLKRKRVVRLVSSTLLWQKFLSETQASAPFQKLRKNWLLIIQIILLILAVLALSRPYFPTKAANSDLRVLILDASASMQATDESPSRFEKAKQEALQWVDSLRKDDKMVVLQVAGNTEVKQSETSDKESLRRAIRSCKAVDSPTRLIPALKMAESLVRNVDKQSNPEIHLFSDGAVPDASVFENVSLPLVFHKVGKGANNIGITALAVRPNPENPAQRAIYANAVNFSSNSLTTQLELRLDGELVEAPRNVSIKPGEISPQVFLATQTNDGVFTLRSLLSDDLAADNEVSIVSILPHTVRVLLVTTGNNWLEKALRHAPNVELTVVPSLASDSSSYDLVVLDNLSPVEWPGGNVMAVHVTQTNWFDKVSGLQSPVIVDYRPTHPVMRFVNLDNVHVAESFSVPTPGWGLSLVDSAQSPLIVAGDFGRQRILWIGFDLLQSDWPWRQSFPMFIQNAVDWLNPASVRNEQLLVHAGDPFRFTPPQPVSSAQVKLPDGSTEKIDVATNASEVVFGRTFQHGTYHLQAGTNEVTFCAALLDEAESNIKPREEIQFGKYTKVTATTLHRTNMELWRAVAAVALAVLLFEWWYYHRRTV